MPAMLLQPWILTLMTALQPSAPWIDSYPATADGIAEAAEEQPLFAGEEGPRRTAALLVSIGWFESRFDAGAVGDCDKGKPKSFATCRSFGMFQVERSNFIVPVEVVMSDVGIAARETLRMVRKSREVCGHRPAEDMLGWYGHGRSGCDHALVESRHRVRKAKWLERTFPFGGPDDT